MALSLPPGCGFYPSEEQLLCYYLTHKNRRAVGDAASGSDDFNACDFIKEVDLYSYQPSELPENACFGYSCGGMKKHWYCYTKVSAAEASGRSTKGGFWKMRDKGVQVVDSAVNSVIGNKSEFVFYLGNPGKSAIRTNWVLFEYALVGQACFVVCRVFDKSHCGSDESSLDTPRDIGVQHDGFLSPDSVEAIMIPDCSVDISEDPPSLTADLNDQITTNSIPVGDVQHPSGCQSVELDSEFSLIDRSMLEAGHDQLLLSIMKEDFIELDDLID
ncbi:hypothetical protein K2173_028002 [Erythroxylum novogranatense]|uniref:NAC domain-containing protein n=1 Tax=Erythroxylum novogranatense TaxID=1862640 RepID=A0AAV8U0S9_9ROSI|nr:hypothetical protein K2173_028002 [Erythroxylum novogranatense]